MAGAASFALGDRSEARLEIERAMSLRLDETEARLATAYLDALSPGLPARGRGWDGAVLAGWGFDSNVFQSGILDRADYSAGSTSSASSGAATAGLDLAFRWSPRSMLFAEVAYAADQLAYSATEASDFSLQQHAATAALEATPFAGWRLGASGSGLVAATGLSSFRGYQAAISSGVWAALDETDSTSTRLDLEAARKKALAGEFSYVGGTRLEAALSQELRLGRIAGELAYRYRDERIGTLTQAAQFPLPDAFCPAGCSQRYVIPFAHSSSTASISARAALGAHWRLRFDGGFEWRQYATDSYLLVERADGTSDALDRVRRRDRRLFGGAAGTLRLWGGLEWTLRYDLVVNRSNLGGRGSTGRADCFLPGVACQQLDYDDKNYVKHALGIETGFVW